MKDLDYIILGGAIVAVAFILNNKRRASVSFYCPDGKVFCATLQQCLAREDFALGCPGYAPPAWTG